MRRFGLMFLAVGVGGALLSVPAIALGLASEIPFASVVEPIGVAASHAKLLVTRPYTGNPRQVVSISADGTTVTQFAKLPDLPNGLLQREEYLAIASAAADFLNAPTVMDPLVPNRKFTANEAGFAAGFVYVTQGAKIIKISPDGTAQALFADLNSLAEGGCGATHTGIAFDRVGTFGFFLIVVCNNGNVWLLNKDGKTVDVNGIVQINPAPIFNLTTLTRAAGPFEGPDVAPTSGFNPFGGRLLVAAETSSQVFAVSSAGVSSAVAVPAAEGVAFIPSPLCDFSSSGGTYFAAVFETGSISKLPQSAVTGLGGALVPSESGTAGVSPGITQLTTNGTTGFNPPTTFSTFSAQHEGTAFCIDSVPVDITSVIRREPADPINPNANGVITVRFFPIPGIFNPFTKTDFRAGITGTEKSLKDCEPNPVAGGARQCHFFTNKLGIPGPGVYRGLLHFKAIPGDGAEGCG